ncbi:MAG: ABC transporter ATP-binding protein [Chloroflexi bacterium]|nr:ABC transporter ATP-binding protein [Chloroflexota bacterium]
MKCWSGADCKPPLPVELRHATKVYPGNVRALHDVTLRVEEGDRACLLGPNGAGKTTVIRLLNGALAPTRGEVLLFGEPSGSAGFLGAKRRSGVVPQAPGMYEDLTAAEYLELVRRLYGRGDLSSIAEPFGLTPFLHRRLAQLSGGFQRRVTLAAALLAEPDLLLLDEPTAGLDPIAARDTHEFLRRMMESRTTLLCTHNLAEAEALCNSVIILRAGKVLLHEKIDALRRRFPRRVFLAARQGPDALATQILRMGRAIGTDQQGVWITVTEPELELPALLRELLISGLDVYESHVVEPSLEGMFLELMQEADQ